MTFVLLIATIGQIKIAEIGNLDQHHPKICDGVACIAKASFLPKVSPDLTAYCNLHQSDLRCATIFIALGR